MKRTSGKKDDIKDGFLRPCFAVELSTAFFYSPTDKTHLSVVLHSKRKTQGERFMTSDYSSESIRELYERNFDTLYRVCYMYMKNIQDTEDAVHNAFLKAIETRKQFESENHEKAWLIRVASNICKNMLMAACRKNEPLNDNIPDSNISNEAKELLSELSKLPDKLKIPVYLFYYDGYSSEEIGQMLHISSSAVRTRLQKAREQLRNVLGDERSVE